MQTKQLEYFLAVAEELSFTRAAKRCFVSQAALSMQIKALEKELDARLFNRDRHHVALTPAGSAFLDDARDIMRRLEGAAAKARRAETAMGGELRIGYVKGYERTDLAQMLHAFHTAYPAVLVSLMRENVADLYDALRAEEVDIVINMMYPGAEDTMLGVDWQVLRHYPLMAALPLGHPLADRKTVELEELRGYPIVKYRMGDNGYGESDRINTVISGIGLYDYPAHASCITWDIETSVLCVSAGFGYVITPGYFAERLLANEGVVAVPIEGLEEEITVVAAWLPNTKNELIDVFLDEFLMVEEAS